ncbi:hypothetical protein AB1Y20_007991 [Prymnesium parvum]|uniref:Axonemal dynein light chain domain-containing protein 1 n=1 Tax=Prymnesium parvum TaxID=97485 RepID=A0AB34IVV1_PRYPA
MPTFRPDAQPSRASATPAECHVLSLPSPPEPPDAPPPRASRDAPSIRPPLTKLSARTPRLLPSERASLLRQAVATPPHAPRPLPPPSTAPHRRLFTKETLPSLSGDVARLPNPCEWRQPPSTHHLPGLRKSKLPPSGVPEKYHVHRHEAVRPIDSNCHAVWDEEEQMWQVTVFPAINPSGREQIGYLHDALNEMLEAERLEAVACGALPPDEPVSAIQIFESASDPDAAYRTIHSIYAAGIAEVSRQVACHCTERGQLLVNLWASAQALKDRFIAMKLEELEDLHAKHVALSSSIVNADQRLQQSNQAETTLASTMEELERVKASREKLISMVKSLQAAMISIEEQLRVAQNKRRYAEHQLATWLPNASLYAQRASHEALEAYVAISRGAGEPLGAAEVQSRAAAWMARVRAEAAKLADWEAPPQLSEAVPLRAEALKLMLRDVERVLGALLCLRVAEEEEAPPADAAEEPQGVEELQAERRRLLLELQGTRQRAASDAAAYERQVASLRAQIAEMRSERDEAERRRMMGGSLEAMVDEEERDPLTRQDSAATSSSNRGSDVGGGRLSAAMDTLDAVFEDPPEADSLDAHADSLADNAEEQPVAAALHARLA